MSNRPEFIMLIDIECISVDDWTGDDELIGRFDDLQATDFIIGQFNPDPGNKIALNIEAIVPIGVTTLQIIEKDLMGDDLIGTINLAENMSVENEAALSNNSAIYNLRYIVT